MDWISHAEASLLVLSLAGACNDFAPVAAAIAAGAATLALVFALRPESP